jgi:uncharacterized membrane protein
MAQDKRLRRRRFALRANLWTLRLARNWLRIVLTMLAIYVTLPFVAPTLMRLGVEGPARAIYTLYSPFCHQFAFRTIFLHGEQPFYPRYNTGSPLTPFESYAEQLPEFAPERTVARMGPVGDIYAFTPGFQIASREFLGNQQMGYKMTLCARDIAIYSGILIGGLLYALPAVRLRLRPVPLWLYVFLGLGPIGLDGFSQLLSYPPFELWPPRETLPLFRVLTGGIFGLMSAWLAFPYLDLSLRDTRYEIEAKLARAGIRV